MSALDFAKSLAVVIGIDAYKDGIAPLRTAVADACSVAELLAQKHDYQVLSLLDEDAQLADLQTLIEKTLPSLLSDNSRLFFYFAGHGIAQDGDDGPAGYLVPQDALPGAVSSYLSMVSLHDALTALPCRHFLAVFDCCFAGAFRWASTRKIALVADVIHRERYDRFRQDPAWQVITSAAYDQTALDALSLRDERGAVVVDDGGESHSPFAAALLLALQGNADSSPSAQEGKPAGDGVTTATELYLYLRDQVETLTEGRSVRQTPEICTLRNHNRGEYIFLTPDHELNLPPAPPLNKENNPYRGLESFDRAHKDLFFGRDIEIERLLEKIQAQSPLVVVLGASGTGKSSLVKAGLLPRLEEDSTFHVLPVMRPGREPIEALMSTCEAITSDLNVSVSKEGWIVDDNRFSQLIVQWKEANPNRTLLLIIDQAEELITQADSPQESAQFQRLLKKAMAKHWQCLRVVATLRLDFEAQFQDDELREEWMDARFVIPPMNQVQLRAAIEKPAQARVLYFEPYSLVDKLIEDVAQTPGALPLLSFTLSELYLRYLERRRDNRALTEADYRVLGGVAGSLTKRATEEYERLVAEDSAYEQTVKHVMLRMVSLEGSGLARRRVLLSELVYVDTDENERVRNLLQRMIRSRLLVKGQVETEEPYVEPAHDALIRGWDKLLRWKNEEQISLGLQRELTPQAKVWQLEEALGHRARAKRFLWNENPRLDLLKAVLFSKKNWLNAVEEKFVRQSVARKRARRARLIVSLLAVMLGLSGISAAAMAQRQEAERQATVAMLREQATRVLSLLPTPDSSFGLLMAIDAMGQSRPFPVLHTEAEVSLLSAVQRSQELNRIETHKSHVLAVAFGPNGNRIVTGSRDKTLQIWDAQTGEQIGEPLEGHAAGIFSVAYSPDGERIVSASDDGTLRLWNAKTGKQVGEALTDHTDRVVAVAFNRDSRRFVSGSVDKTIRIWDAQTGKPVGSPIEGHDKAVFSVAFSPNGKQVVSGSVDRTLRLWDVESGAQIGQPMKGHTSMIRAVAFSPTGERLASGSFDKAIRLWDVKTGTQIGQPLLGHTEEVKAITFSKDGQRLVSGSADKTLRIWNAETGALLGDPLTGHKAGIAAVDFRPGSNQVASGSWDGTVRLWNVEANTLVGSPLSGHTDGVYSVAFSPDGERLVSGSRDRSLRVWDVRTGDPDGVPIDAHDEAIFAVAFSPDGQRVVSGGVDKTVRLWDVKTGQLVNDNYGTHNEAVMSVAFSPDNRHRYIASGSLDKTLRLWNAQTGEAVGEPLVGHSEEVLAVAFSHDGRYLVSGSFDKTLRLWDVVTREAVGEPFVGHEEPVMAVAFSRDGKRIVSGSLDMTIRLWDVSTREQIGDPITGHQDGVLSVEFGMDDQRLVSGSADKTLRLWDVKTGKPIGSPLTGHQDAVVSVAFSPDGEKIVTASSDKTLRIWDANTSSDDWMDIACRRVLGHPGLSQPESISTDAEDEDIKEIASRSKTFCEQRNDPDPTHNIRNLPTARKDRG